MPLRLILVRPAITRLATTCLAIAGVLLWLAPAHGAYLGRAVQPTASGICRNASAAAEAALHVPDAFLSAIAKVESGRPDPATGVSAPWPWTINAEGRGSFYASKAEAVAAVRALQASGVRSIDVGCLQVNLLHHPNAFASLEEALDPGANAMYAAGFLVALFHQTGSWPLAAAAYHSQTPTLGAPYERRVLAEWAMPDAAPGVAQPKEHVARAAPEHVATAQGPDVSASLPAAGPQHGVAAWAPVGRAPVMGEVANPGGHVAGPMGRSLAAYRLLPVRLALRGARPGF